MPALGWGLLFLLPLGSLSSSPPDLRAPEFMRRADEAVGEAFNLNFDKADVIFQKLKEDYPDHPAPPLYLGATMLFRTLYDRKQLSMDSFLDPSHFLSSKGPKEPPEKRTRFFDYMKESRDLSQRILDRFPNQKDAMYFMGAAYGVEAGYDVTIDHSVEAAFNNANRAYEYDDKIIRKNPDYYDAYLTVGVYKYVVGNLPWYLKFFVTMIAHGGNAKEGLKDINLAAEKGKNIGDTAETLLMILHALDEDYGKAADAARKLSEDYPENYIFAVSLARILQLDGKDDPSFTEYRQVLDKAEQGVPNYNLIPMATFRYEVGERFFEMRRFDAARLQFAKAVADEATPEKDKVRSHLRLGEILDLEGERDEALAQYRTVLEMEDYGDSHQEARKYLAEPYREIKKK